MVWIYLIIFLATFSFFVLVGFVRDRISLVLATFLALIWPLTFLVSIVIVLSYNFYVVYKIFMEGEL